MVDTNLSALLWSVAHLLRGDYKQSEYGKVILQFQGGDRPSFGDDCGVVVVSPSRQLVSNLPTNCRGAVIAVGIRVRSPRSTQFRVSLRRICRTTAGPA